MAKNRNRKATQLRRDRHERRKIKLNLQPNQEAFIGDDGKVAVRSNDIRGKDNYGLVSSLGTVQKQLLFKEPTQLAMDADYKMRQGLPRFVDRENGVCLF